MLVIWHFITPLHSQLNGIFYTTANRKNSHSTSQSLFYFINAEKHVFQVLQHDMTLGLS